MMGNSTAELRFDDLTVPQLTDVQRQILDHTERRRIDLMSGEWDENCTFPKHETTEFPYRLSRPHLDFQEAVLDYCLSIVSRSGSGQRERRHCRTRLAPRRALGGTGRLRDRGHRLPPGLGAPGLPG